jgi:hypothetical protein
MRRAFAIDVLACPRCGGRMSLDCAVLQPGQHVPLTAEGRAQDDRDGAGLGIGLQGAEDRESLEGRHPHVEDDDIGPLARHGGQGGFPVADADHPPFGNRCFDPIRPLGAFRPVE